MNLPAQAIDAGAALTGMLPDELVAQLATWSEPPYRAKQIAEWVFRRGAQSYEEMTNLSQPLRQKLAAWKPLHTMQVATIQGSADTTRKFLFRLHDRRYVESVFIPANPAEDGSRATRRTLCVSSQVGCAYDCKFCASGLAGFTRNLRADEIVEQVLQAERHTAQRVDNIVFMGMGEPLANLTHVLRAIAILTSPWGVNIGARHITVSTSGLAPQIKKLADSPVPVRLALSLHGATDDVRSQIMPVNRKYPIDVLFDSLRYFRDRKKQKITFEYILIENINDSLAQAKILARRAKSIGSKVNLIPYNTVDGLQWKRPSELQQEAFCAVLRDAGVVATIRREKGHDIDAACGQLRLKQEVEDAGVVT